MQKRCPEKTFIPAPVEDDTCACSECAFMKLNTLEKLHRCLVEETPEVQMDAQLMDAARLPIERMFKLS
jgi:quinolinate synthase